MKRLAFFTVGTEPDVAESIAFSVQRYNPDHLVFFTTEALRQPQLELWDLLGIDLEAADESTRRIAGEIAGGEFRGLSFAIPVDESLDGDHDAAALHLGYRRLMQREFDIEPEDFEWLRKNAMADFTCGTRPMSAALFGAAYALGIKTLIYTSGSGDDHGEAFRSHATRARSLRAVEWTEHAVELFNRGEYVEAAHQAERLGELQRSHLPKQGHFGKIILCASRAFEAWERFRFRDALEHFECLNDADEIDQSVVGQHLMNKARRGQVMRHLHEASSSDMSLRLLADVYANGCRRLDERAFDDALGRLYRAWEYTAQLRLHEKFGLTTAEFPVDRVTDDMGVDPNDDGQTCRMGAEATWRYLAEEGDELAGEYRRILEETDLRVAILQRNTSLLAHGFDPVGEDYARCMADAVDRLARTGWGDEAWRKRLEVCEFPRIEQLRM